MRKTVQLPSRTFQVWESRKTKLTHKSNGNHSYSSLWYGENNLQLSSAALTNTSKHCGVLSNNRSISSTNPVNIIGIGLSSLQQHLTRRPTVCFAFDNARRLKYQQSENSEHTDMDTLIYYNIHTGHNTHVQIKPCVIVQQSPAHCYQF